MHLNQHKYKLSKNFSSIPLLVESPQCQQKKKKEKELNTAQNSEGLRLLKKILVNAHGNVPRILRGYPYNSHQSIKRRVRKNVEQRSRQFPSTIPPLPKRVQRGSRPLTPLYPFQTRQTEIN